jgi:hypothetical protein
MMLSRLNHAQANVVLEGQTLLLKSLKYMDLQNNPIIAEVMQAKGKTLRSKIHTCTCFECVTLVAEMEGILVP